MNKTMKAAILTSPGVVEVKDVAIPDIGPDDVLIEVAYAGICGSDLPRSQNDNGARMYPLILGHEFSGIVKSIGSNVTQIQTGDKVAVAPLIPDPESFYTKSGKYGLSDNYNIIGTGSNGSFAEFVKVPEHHVVKMPESLDLETAAGVEPATISFHALTRSAIEVGDTVAVLGCGAIGQFAVQCAKVFGASKVVAVDIDDEKLELSKELGADYSINSLKEDLMQKTKKLTPHGLGFDVVIETAGTAITQQQSIDVLKKRGHTVWVGISNTNLDLPAETVDHLLRGEITVTGSWNSYTAPYPGNAWTAVLDFMEKGQIKFKPMVSHKIKLEEVNDYLKGMFNNEVSFNKVLVDLELEDQEC